MIGILKQETEGIYIADHLILLLVEVLVILIAGRVFQKKGWISNQKVVYILLVLVYINMLLSLTIFRRMPGSRDGIVHLKINLGFGLRTGRPSNWTIAFSLLNILLFVPFGVLAYPVLRNYKRIPVIISVTLAGALTSLMIECIQLITGRGMFEITDLLTNTAGAFIGVVVTALLYNTVFKALRKKS